MLAKLGETAEKGLLGGYKGAAGDWDKVVRAYEYNRERHCFIDMLYTFKAWQSGESC